jgi:cation transport regulator ChaC
MSHAPNGFRSALSITAPVPPPLQEPTFDYFAYGSCMCPVDLKRSLGAPVHTYVVGPAKLSGYRLGFYRRSRRRNCGVLDIVPAPDAVVEGVLYRLPWRFSASLEEREEVPRGGYRQHPVAVLCGNQLYSSVRTYVVVDKLTAELAPDDGYFQVVLRGAITCGLSESYCWQLFEHMHGLQRKHS